MQKELAQEMPGLKLQLLAVNEVGHEGGLMTMADLGDLPLLQDVAETRAWSTWKAVYRDVVIVDANGKIVDVYNLTVNNLGDAARYQELKQKLIDAAK